LQIGINCENDRAAIMLAVENYLSEVKLSDSRSSVTASAPLEEASTSDQDDSIQNVNIIECVICFDLQVNVFIHIKFQCSISMIISLLLYQLSFFFAVRSDFFTLWTLLLLLYLCRKNFCRMSNVQKFNRT